MDDCLVMSREMCNTLPAPNKFHEDAELCSDVDCLPSICGMGSMGSLDGTPNQFWRFLTPIFMHVGIGHIFFNVLCQLRIGSDIENMTGFWKMAVMYILSGVGGNIFAAIMDPETLSCGASSSIYGLVAVQMVDLALSWNLVQHKWATAALMIVQLIALLGFGTLPWFDNFAHIGGFVVGIICGYSLLPYIHFNRKDRWTKQLTTIHSRFFLLVIFVILLGIFYSVRDTEHFCSWCKYLNCVPYTHDFCKSVWH